MATHRVTITADADALAEISREVDAGHADSVSAWIAEAIAQRRARDARLAVLAQLVDEYESEHGVITADEVAEQRQADRDAAAFARRGDERVGT